MNQIKEQINKQIVELTKQLEALELLETVWNELGPYENGLPPKLNMRLQNFFNFDDSE